MHPASAAVPSSLIRPLRNVSAQEAGTFLLEAISALQQENRMAVDGGLLVAVDVVDEGADRPALVVAFPVGVQTESPAGGKRLGVRFVSEPAAAPGRDRPDDPARRPLPA